MTVGMQMPKLFLRGSFVNVTIKNLTDDEQREVEEIVRWIKDDPLLQPTRYQFKSALRNTIRGDYNDDEAADQEYCVAIWKAVVAAKHGWGKNGPSEQTITNPIQRKKFFQSWVFNFLRQILTENKRSYIDNKSVAVRTTFDAARIEILSVLPKNCKVKTNDKSHCSIESNLFLLPLKKINELLKLKLKYFNKNVIIEMKNESININNNGSKGYEMIEINTPALVNTASTSRTVEEGGVPEPSIDTAGFSDPDTIETMYDSLSDDAQKVMRIITNPPHDYVEKYGDKIARSYIKEYLSLSPKEVKDIWSELKLTFAAIIGNPD